MKVSLEISMYPLADEYIPAIQSFIDDISRKPGIDTITNTMSTQLFGEFEVVMDALREGLRASWERNGKSVFVLKFLNSDLQPG